MGGSSLVVGLRSAPATSGSDKPVERQLLLAKGEGLQPVAPTQIR